MKIIFVQLATHKQLRMDFENVCNYSYIIYTFKIFYASGCLSAIYTYNYVYLPIVQHMSKNTHYITDDTGLPSATHFRDW